MRGVGSSSDPLPAPCEGVVGVSSPYPTCDKMALNRLSGGEKRHGVEAHAVLLRVCIGGPQDRPVHDHDAKPRVSCRGVHLGEERVVPRARHGESRAVERPARVEGYNVTRNNSGCLVVATVCIPSSESCNFILIHCTSHLGIVVDC